MSLSNEGQLRRFAVVLHDSNDAITVQDLDGNILAWNKGAERIYGYTEKEALCMNISSIVPEGKSEEATAYLKDIKAGKKVESFETVRTKRDGTVIDVWLVLTCLENDNGEIDSVASTERDITSTKMEIRRLRGFLPICAQCKSIRNDTGYWQRLEAYIEERSGAKFSHGLCPTCSDKFYGEEEWYKKHMNSKSSNQTRS